MKDMGKCIGAEDVFFDSSDHLSEENDSAFNGVLGYECWMNEPKSIKERRHTFLSQMDFIEPCSSMKSNDDHDDGDDHHHNDDGLERTVEIKSGDLSSSCSSSSFDSEEENVVFFRRECNGNANMDGKRHEHDYHIRQSRTFYEDDEPSTSTNGHKSINKKIRHWWKEMMNKQRGGKCKEDNEKPQKFEMSRKKVQVNKKKFKELSALFEVDEIQAHKGIIWTMKFSPDGQYLATGGEDGVVRVWRVKSVDSSLDKFTEESIATPREKNMKIPVIVPDKMFKIDEFPVQEFHGHAADVLDLDWSESNFILSSSMDKTVRLWQIGTNACLNTFHHTDYVTCVHFNPEDNRYFISGSIDGKVRKWGVLNQRVLDWVDIRDAVTAVCYQPDGQAFVVGSLSGSCYFYETKDELFELNAHIQLHKSKRSSTNRITGIQFSSEDSQRIMVMSEDSKIRILDKMEIVCKFRGLPKSGSQMSASFTSDKRHIVSIGQDSRVYIWNHDKSVHEYSSSRHTRSNRSSEHFYSEGVSVALPWCGTERTSNVSSSWNTEHETVCIARDPPNNFSLSNLFSAKSSATWPEDILPVFTQSEDQCHQGRNNVAHCSTWGLVIVTANLDGKIKTFHNYGLPIRV